MSAAAPDDAALHAARRLLADAEQAALDEVLALRAAARALHDEAVALRAEAAQMVERAETEAEALRIERAALDARAAELDQQALSVAAPEPADPLVGAQAEMRALSALLEELQGRVEELGHRSASGEDTP